MTKHYKKIQTEHFENILSGDKTFELRLADWECVAGDVLILQEWNPATRDYTGREIKKDVTYVLKTKDIAYFSPKEIEEFGYQIISFKQ
jgi:hypothetical protein